MELGEKVRKARIAHRLTVDALGKASGLSKGFISQVESGRSNPSLASLNRIAAALGTDVTHLLHSTDAEGKATVLSPRVYRLDELPITQRDPVIVDGPSGARYALLKLPPGASLGEQRGAYLVGAVSLAVVLSGEATLCGIVPEQTLAAGDVTILVAGNRCRLENRGSNTVTLLVSVEVGAAFPEISHSEEDPHIAGRGAPRQIYATEGPLRLAALRATGRGRRKE